VIRGTTPRPGSRESNLPLRRPSCGVTYEELFFDLGMRLRGDPVAVYKRVVDGSLPVPHVLMLLALMPMAFVADMLVMGWLTTASFWW
jgi:hypothetical protein